VHALKTTREDHRSQRPSRGFSLIELLIVVAIILIIAALAIPNFLQAKISANQASAAATIRTINTASVSYSAAWNDGYPPNLATLGASGGQPQCTGAMLIDATLAADPAKKSGYTFSYAPQGGAIASPPAGCAAGYWAYLITAIPNSILTGTDSFCSDESYVLHYDVTGSAIPTAAACEALPAMQ